MYSNCFKIPFLSLFLFSCSTCTCNKVCFQSSSKFTIVGTSSTRIFISIFENSRNSFPTRKWALYKKMKRTRRHCESYKCLTLLVRKQPHCHKASWWKYAAARIRGSMCIKRFMQAKKQNVDPQQMPFCNGLESRLQI